MPLVDPSHPVEISKLTPIVVRDALNHGITTGLRGYLLGYGIRGSFSLLLHILSVIRGKMALKDAIARSLGRETQQLGAFFGAFAFLWKSTHDLITASRNGYVDKLNGAISGSVAGIALLFEDSGRRVGIAQQMLVRALQAVYNGLKERQHFEFPLGDALMFALSSAQIMYAYVLHPTKLAKEYYRFILKTGPIPEDTLNVVRSQIRGGKLPDLTELVAKHRATARNYQLASGYNLVNDAIIGCEILHPHNNSCVVNSGGVARKVFRGIFPVYFALYLVPTAIFKPKILMSKPVQTLIRLVLSTARSGLFLAAFVAGYQAFVCWIRKLHGFGIVPRDNKVFFWLAGFVCSASIFIEPKGRRGELAMYVAPKAAEVVYTMLYSRRLAPYIPNFEIFMFSVAMGILISSYDTEPHNISPIGYRLLKAIDTFIEAGSSKPGPGGRRESLLKDTDQLGTVIGGMAEREGIRWEARNNSIVNGMTRDEVEALKPDLDDMNEILKAREEVAPLMDAALVDGE